MRTIIVIKELLHQPIKMPDSYDSTELWTSNYHPTLEALPLLQHTACEVNYNWRSWIKEWKKKVKSKREKQSYHKMMSRYYVLYVWDCLPREKLFFNNNNKWNEKDAAINNCNEHYRSILTLSLYHLGIIYLRIYNMYFLFIF